jgi:lantibiotic modifying enzyme
MIEAPYQLCAAAAAIADLLCETAYWNADRSACNWVAEPIEPQRSGRMRSLGLGLYDGLSGIALFLAAAERSLGAPRFRETCRGALEAARRQADSEAKTSDLSLFSGRLGYLFVLGQVGALLPDLGIPASTEMMYALTSQAMLRPHAVDIIGGSAGAVCAMLNCQPAAARPLLLPLAVWLGEDILRRAQRIGGALAWTPDDASAPGVMRLPLCGISHGASGMAAALLMLVDATGRRDFLEGARRALLYEDHAFDPGIGSWPDLRIDAAPDGRAVAFDAWCHGAGGIALVRMLACRSDREFSQNHHAPGLLALNRTTEILRERTNVAESDDSLCHGVAGMAELCKLGASAFGLPSSATVANRAAKAIAAKYLDFASSQSWPTHVVANPGLMLGSAGVGYALLRLAGSAMPPSVLALFDAGADAIIH